MENNFYPEQNGNNGQFPEQNQYAQPQYNQQYGNQFPGQNQYAQPQYNNQYTQNQYGNQQYSQGYNQPYNQQYQPYGYNQGGYTVPPQKKPVNPVVMSIPAAIIPTVLTLIYSLFSSYFSYIIIAVSGVLLNFMQIAAVGLFGFLAYKKAKGAAAFLGCYFISSCVACIPMELLESIIRSYNATTVINYVVTLLTAVLMPVAVLLYEKLRDKDTDTPQTLQPLNTVPGMMKAGNSLYNPVFIGIGAFAVTFINRLAVAISNYNLSTYLSYGRGYIRDSALSSLIVNIFTVGMVFAVGLLLSKSLKKVFEFGGYVCISMKIAIVLNVFTAGTSGNLVLGIFLALLFAFIGTGAALGFAFVSEGVKNKKTV